VVVVAMGRGGPLEPVVLERPPALADLLARSQAGEHAASDYLEDAALAHVVTVGARRCGGGLAGEPFTSNVPTAARVAAELEPDLVVFEGSGSAVPPVAAGARVLVADAASASRLGRFLGPYRILLADLVVLTMCEEPLASAETVARARATIADIKPNVAVVATVLRPRPTQSVEGRRIAYFTTAPVFIHGKLREQLERRHGAEVVFVSGNLADRGALARDLAAPATRKADVFLTELKAAAVDVVAETGAERGVEVVLVANDVEALPGEPDLDEQLLALADAVVPAVPVGR
jgi:cyclic 2,3-diphosphoglycerate synthetase